MTSRPAALAHLRKFATKRLLAWAVLAGTVAWLLEPAYPRFPDIPPDAISVRLVSATGALPSDEVKPFTHLYVRNGDLHVVSRTFFFKNEPLGKPYLVVGPDGRGTVHVYLRPHWQFMGSMCEFKRQFEVVVPASHWTRLTAIKVSNDSAYGDVTDWLPLGDATTLEGSPTVSRQQAELERMESEGRGC